MGWSAPAMVTDGALPGTWVQLKVNASPSASLASAIRSTGVLPSGSSGAGVALAVTTGALLPGMPPAHWPLSRSMRSQGVSQGLATASTSLG